MFFQELLKLKEKSHSSEKPIVAILRISGNSFYCSIQTAVGNICFQVWLVGIFNPLSNSKPHCDTQTY